MASRSFQEFWLLAMHFLVENATTTVESHTQALAGPETMTGSILLKKTYDTYVSGKRDAVREMICRVAVRFPVNLRPESTVSTIELLEPSCWYPMNWANVIHDQLLWELRNNTIKLGGRTKRWLFPSSYLVTYWGHSWKKAPSTLRHALINYAAGLPVAHLLPIHPTLRPIIVTRPGTNANGEF